MRFCPRLWVPARIRVHKATRQAPIKLVGPPRLSRLCAWLRPRGCAGWGGGGQRLDTEWTSPEGQPVLACGLGFCLSNCCVWVSKEVKGFKQANAIKLGDMYHRDCGFVFFSLESVGFACS